MELISFEINDRMQVNPAENLNHHLGHIDATISIRLYRLRFVRNCFAWSFESAFFRNQQIILLYKVMNPLQIDRKLLMIFEICPDVAITPLCMFRLKLPAFGMNSSGSLNCSPCGVLAIVVFLFYAQIPNGFFEFPLFAIQAFPAMIHSVSFKQFCSIRKPLILLFVVHPLGDSMLIAQFADPALSFQLLKHSLNLALLSMAAI